MMESSTAAMTVDLLNFNMDDSKKHNITERWITMYEFTYIINLDSQPRSIYLGEVCMELRSRWLFVLILLLKLQISHLYTVLGIFCTS